jgi:hypothetical protein
MAFFYKVWEESHIQHVRNSREMVRADDISTIYISPPLLPLAFLSFSKFCSRQFRQVDHRTSFTLL